MFILPCDICVCTYIIKFQMTSSLNYYNPIIISHLIKKTLTKRVALFYI